MAQKVNITLVSDLSGEEIAEGKGETVTYSIDNAQYEIDLTKKEADKFRGLFQDHIAVSRKVSGGRGKRSTSTSSGGGRSKDELSKIRVWASENGHEVSERGRISKAVTDAYDAAH